ncbi:LysR family transcriptional regulator [Methylobacterium organophilum]|uniref:HTH-type transcriptional regulator YhaJ n=1 Tax=Methylobacterium organophilum TaxID=410 RepID=A0ABQ4TEE0_METOR|nr:LysR family transcriptional regulator [Methylobacterium organophilum]UMY17329.1 LysR family transcriptional regulator [Methylobacterium organophilum]GJE29285.1 HTH-type transcriptional regulator YhaJ [Methylobacterium organophilum]
MQGPGTPTLDQLTVFLTVVEAGSFAAAGRKLNRATSVISYAIANLELQLGLPLFDRESTRRPQLTEAGRAVLAEARTVSHSIGALRAKVRGLLGGLESEVSFVVEVMLPTARLVDALQAFRETFPTVDLRLHVESLGAVTQYVNEGRAVIGITGPIETGIDTMERIAVGSVEMVPVAAPLHPLAQASANLPGAVRDHVQLVLSDRSPLTAGRDFAVLATHTWRLADLSAKHALLLAGIGWGSLPLPMIEADLAAGRLKRLAIPEAVQRRLAFSAIYRTDTPPGPAASWLIRRFVEQAEETETRAAS